jgi:succinoglycan biosynthesis transport protein ExoP
MTRASEQWEQVKRREGLIDAVRSLRRHWLFVAAIVAVCVAVAIVSHERKAVSYTANASVVFHSGTLSESALQVSPASSPEPLREANTEVGIAHSSEVAEAVRKQLAMSASDSELLEMVKVEAAPSADILNFIASNGHAATAARLANAFAEQYIAFRVKSELAGIEAAQSKLEQQLASLPAASTERANLQTSLQRLSELRAVAGGGASVIGKAQTPTSPSGSGVTTSVVIGVLLGLAIGLSLLFVVESLDRRVKTIEDFEHEYRLSTLTVVPELTRQPRLAADRGELLEPYRILRSALDIAAVTRQLSTLAVTSAMPGEGKTTVAVDLAHAVALTGRRVVLVELDLRRPTFAQHFELLNNEGLTTALVESRPIADVLVEPFAELPNLSVLPAGPLPHNPSELLGSPRIADIISSLVSYGSMVIIDAPPLNPVADAQVLLNSSAIRASIIVARINQTTREDIRRARAILDRQIAEPVGIVITGLKELGSYGYGYGYGSAPGEAPSVHVKVDPPSEPAGSLSWGMQD